jgi:flagellar biosynthesis protein FlhF
VFKAATIQAAMLQVKSELGIDAVILHTKKYHKGGFLGYKGKEVVELTAAVDDVPRKASTERENKKFAGNETNQADRVFSQDPIVPRNIVTQYKSAGNLDRMSASETAPSTKLQKDTGQNRFPPTVNDDLQEQKIKQLEAELSQIKMMLQQTMSDPINSSQFVSVPEILAEHEVSDTIIHEILKGISEKQILQNKDAPEVLEHLTTYFDHIMHSGNDIIIKPQKTKIIALIGATGVGKTTTLAKLAARFVLEKEMNVALITADTYRISAVEQLKTYSDIIGLTLETVYSPTDLKAAIDKHRDKQLILIDTAGRSQHNDFQLNELRELLAVDSNIEKHLVLSATTKYKDAVDIIRKFSLCAPDRVLFTKVDETSSIGTVVNLIHEYPITLSYFTNGQSVPDDIIPASSRGLAELLLR